MEELTVDNVKKYRTKMAFNIIKAIIMDIVERRLEKEILGRVISNYYEGGWTVYFRLLGSRTEYILVELKEDRIRVGGKGRKFVDVFLDKSIDKKQKFKVMEFACDFCDNVKQMCFERSLAVEKW